jgi:hypothetical protein
MPLEVSILTKPQQDIYGLWADSSDRTVPKDIPALSKKYYQTLERPFDSVFPFYVLSKGYDRASKRFRLLIAGQEPHHQLEAFRLPAGSYGKITVRPAFGFLWGLAVGGAKRYFYMKWLPLSGYGALNMEYELHTDKSVGKRPEIDLLFAIEK